MKRLSVVLLSCFIAVIMFVSLPLVSFADSVKLWELPMDDWQRWIYSSSSSTVSGECYYADFSNFILTIAPGTSSVLNPSNHAFMAYFTYIPLVQDIDIDFYLSSVQGNTGIYYNRTYRFQYIKSEQKIRVSLYTTDKDNPSSAVNVKWYDDLNQNLVLAGFRYIGSQIMPIFWNGEVFYTDILGDDLALDLGSSISSPSVLPQQHNYYLLGMSSQYDLTSLKANYIKLLQLAVASPNFQSHLKDCYPSDSSSGLSSAELQEVLDSVLKDEEVTAEPYTPPSVPEIDDSSSRELDIKLDNALDYNYEGVSVDIIKSSTQYINGVIFAGRLIQLFYDKLDFLKFILALVVVFIMLNAIRGTTFSKVPDMRITTYRIVSSPIDSESSHLLPSAAPQLPSAYIDLKDD